MLGASRSQDAAANGDTRTISLFHNHTRESITIAYMRDGAFDRDALEKLNWFLRDWRRDEPISMDPRLFDVVWNAHRESGSTEPVHVVSAYRSPDTNAMLRRRSSAVAKHSQHMLGKAMDVVMPDVSMAKVREVGLQMQRGGVGWYPTAGTPFVHLDVGTVRAWPRAPREMLARLFPDGKTVHIPSDGTPMVGYAEAAAEIEARGGSAIALAEVKSKGFWATLFGGGDDEDEGYNGKGRTLVASRGKAGGKAAPNTVVASLGPVGPSGGDRDDAGVRAFMNVATAQPQADLAGAPKVGSRLARGRQPVQPSVAPEPQVAVAAAPVAPPREEPAPAVVASLAPPPAPVAQPVPAKPVAPVLAFADVPAPPARPANFGVVPADGVPLPPLRPAIVVASLEAARQEAGSPVTTGALAAAPAAAPAAVPSAPAPLARGEQRAANGLPVAIMGDRAAAALPSTVAAFAPSAPADMPLPPLRQALGAIEAASPVPANVPAPPQRRVAVASLSAAAALPAAPPVEPPASRPGVTLDRAGLDLLTSEVSEGAKAVVIGKVDPPNHVERVAGRFPPGRGRPGDQAFARPAELLQHGDRGAAVAGLGEQRGHLGRGARVAGQHQDPPARVEQPAQRRHLAGDQAQHLDAGQWPAQAGRRQRRRRRVRHYPYALRAEQPHQRRADPVEHRVAAGQHADRAAPLGGEQAGQGRQQRGGPGDPFGGHVGRQQIELPGAAEDHVRGDQRVLCRTPEVGPPAGAETGDGDHVGVVCTHRVTVSRGPGAIFSGSG